MHQKSRKNMCEIQCEVSAQARHRCTNQSKGKESVGGGPPGEKRKPAGWERHSCAAVCPCSIFRRSNRLDLTCSIPHRKVNISTLQAQDVYLEGLNGRRLRDSASNFRPMWPERHFIRSWESKQGFAGRRPAACLFWTQRGFFYSWNKWDVKPGQCATVTCFQSQLYMSQRAHSFYFNEWIVIFREIGLCLWPFGAEINENYKC